MRYIRYAFLAALAIVLVSIAMANRAVVTLNLLPEGLRDLMGINWQIDLPLFIVVFGGIVAGLVIAETEYHREVEVIVEPFKGLALGVFLITVGMSVDIPVVLQNWASLALAVVGVVVVKTIVIGLLLRFQGARRATAAEAGMLMSSPSETTLIVLAAALSAQLIQPSTAAFWQTVTAIGLTITPLLAKAGAAAARRVEMRESSVELPGEHDDDEERAIIVGFGRVGRLIAEMLTEHGKPYIAVDSNIDTVARGRREGYPRFSAMCPGRSFSKTSISTGYPRLF